MSSITGRVPDGQNKYWVSRFENLEASLLNKGEDYIKTLQAEYTKANRSIEAKIATWYSRFAGNNGISLSDANKWLNDKELAEFKWDVSEYLEKARESAVTGQWEKQLENVSARVHISRLEALQTQLRQDTESLQGKQATGVVDVLGDVYEEGYCRTGFEVQKGLGIGWNLQGLDGAQLDKVLAKPWTLDKRTFSDRLWTNKQELIDTVQTQLTQSIMRGDSSDDMVEAVVRRLGVGKYQAERLVRTESAYFASASQHDMYKELGVEEYQIIATLDGVTSEICRDLDGEVVKLSAYQPGVTAPPFHPFCRTATAPYFGDEERYIQRAARGADGKTYYVPSDMKYHDWKKAFIHNGSKSNLPAVRFDDILFANRKGFKNAASIIDASNAIDKRLNAYSDRASKWSGKTIVDTQAMDGKKILGEKQWNCDIILSERVLPQDIIHEHLHARSVSYYTPQDYMAYQAIEEGTVEFYAREISKRLGFEPVERAYSGLVEILTNLNSVLGIGLTDFGAAKRLFNTPMTERLSLLQEYANKYFARTNPTQELRKSIQENINYLFGGITP